MKNRLVKQIAMNVVLAALLLLLLLVLFIYGIDSMDSIAQFHFMAHLCGFLEATIIYNGAISVSEDENEKDRLFSLSALMEILACFFACLFWLLNGFSNLLLLQKTAFFGQYIFIFLTVCILMEYFMAVSGYDIGKGNYFPYAIICLLLLLVLISNQVFSISKSGTYTAGYLLCVPAGLFFGLSIPFVLARKKLLKDFGKVFLPFMVMSALAMICSIATKQLELFAVFVCNSQLMAFCYSFSQRAQHNHYLSNRFKSFISSAEIDKAIASRDNYSEKGKRIEVAILMCRLRNFDELEARESPQRIAVAVNHFIGEITDIIEEYHGIVLDIPEYGVLAAFGVDGNKDDFTLNAVKAASAMREQLKNINSWNLDNHFLMMKIGVAVAFGESVVGNIGSHKHMRYSAISGIVNLCSRIESQANDNEVVITEETAEKCKGKIQTGKIKRVRLKGFSQPVSYCTIEDWGTENE